MAQATVIAELRRLIAEPDTDVYSDEYLGARIDQSEGKPLASLASTIWREKAAAMTALVDMTEGNSSRKLSQLSGQALKMADSLDGTVVAEVSESRRSSRTRKIERQ